MNVFTSLNLAAISEENSITKTHSGYEKSYLVEMKRTIVD